MTTTRIQLFRDIAAELGDLIELTATSTGTTTTFVSTDMFYPDGSLNGRECWYVSGTAGNLAKRRLVYDTTESSNTITVTPAWASNSAVSDVIVLVNSRGTGVTIPEIQAKINQLIRRVADELAVEAADTPATFDATSPLIAIPTTWDWVLGAQAVMDSSMATVYTSLLANAYSVQRWDRKVLIAEKMRSLLSGKSVRLIGAISLAELATDAATTTAPASWLTKVAAAELLEAAALRSGDVATAFTYGELLKAQATQLQVYVGKRFSSVGQRVYVGKG